MFKSIRAAFLATIISLLTLLAVSAQSATQQPDDPTDFVKQAWANFTQLESYHFTYDFDQFHHLDTQRWRRFQHHHDLSRRR